MALCSRWVPWGPMSCDKDAGGADSRAWPTCHCAPVSSVIAVVGEGMPLGFFYYDTAHSAAFLSTSSPSWLQGWRLPRAKQRHTQQAAFDGRSPWLVLCGQGADRAVCLFECRIAEAHDSRCEGRLGRAAHRRPRATRPAWLCGQRARATNPRERATRARPDMRMCLAGPSHQRPKWWRPYGSLGHVPPCIVSLGPSATCDPRETIAQIAHRCRANGRGRCRYLYRCL